MLTLEQLRVAIGEGEIDTVVLAFTDMQGRLQGKRLSAEFFLDEVAEHCSEGCNYLLAVDVDMNTVDGLRRCPPGSAATATSSWCPTWARCAGSPWHEGTALVIADLTWLDGAPVVASPRQILQGADGPAGRPGAGRPSSAPSWSSSSTRTPTSRPRPGTTATWSRPTSTTWTTRSWARRGSSRCCAGSGCEMAGAGLYVESAKGECNLGQHEIAFRYADAVTTCDNHVDLQDRRQGDRGPGRAQHHVHGQAERARGQLLPHPPVAARRPTARRCMAGDGAYGLSTAGRALPGRPARRACAS